MAETKRVSEKEPTDSVSVMQYPTAHETYCFCKIKKKKKV